MTLTLASFKGVYAPLRKQKVAGSFSVMGVIIDPRNQCLGIPVGRDRRFWFIVTALRGGPVGVPQRASGFVAPDYAQVPTALRP